MIQKHIEEGEGIYHYSRSIENERNFILNSKIISEHNKQLIFEFINSRIARGFSKARIAKLLNRLKLIALRLNKDFDKTTKNDSNEFAIHIQNQDLSIFTKNDYKIILRVFYKWLKDNDKVYPNEVEDITIKNTIKRRASSDILTEEDILKLIETTSMPGNKALITVRGFWFKIR